jgi:integrase
MKIQPFHPPEPQEQNLAAQLTEYWAKDRWEFQYCPIKDGCFDFRGKTIYFTCRTPTIQTELKYACWQKLKIQEWKTKTLWSKATDIRLIGLWINTTMPKLNSLIERDLDSLVISFRSYLVNTGYWVEHVNTKLDGNQQVREYHGWSNRLNTLRQIYKVLEAAYDNRDEYDKEVWDVRKLGYRGNPAKSSYTISFANIYQPWLQEAGKAYIKYSLPIFSVGECQGRVGALRSFSRFLQKSYPMIAPSEIDRPVLLDFMSYLLKSKAGEHTRLNTLVRLRAFLEVCAREQWAPVPDKRLIYREDFPKIPTYQPRFIPEEVLAQLNANLDGLSEHVRRMLLILQEVGMRISELCRMPFDCLTRDTQGDYFLRYYQYKMIKEHSVPISREVVAVIKEQQQTVLALYGKHTYLFPSPNLGHRGEPTKHQNFSRALNQLAVERNIRDNTGQLWRFQAHQFRHTVGTRMINLGVPQHIIQRYLGHESPDMTSVYAHIHDKTMKLEFARFKSKIVDVAGKAIQPAELLAEIAEGVDVNNLDDQWLKRNVLAQALPNGICALPIVQKRCPYGANRCLSGADGQGCNHFKTDIRYLDQHKEHLDRVNKILAWAEENPESRRSQEIRQENLPIKQNLERIIASLEGQSNETPA